MSKARRFPGIQQQVGTFAVASLTSLFEKRSWPALSQPEGDLGSINTAVIAIKERLLVQSRERGNVLSSFVTVQDLINIGVIDLSGKTLEQRVADIEARLDAAGIP